MEYATSQCWLGDYTLLFPVPIRVDESTISKLLVQRPKDPERLRVLPQVKSRRCGIFRKLKFLEQDDSVFLKMTF